MNHPACCLLVFVSFVSAACRGNSGHFDDCAPDAGAGEPELAGRARPGAAESETGAAAAPLAIEAEARDPGNPLPDFGDPRWTCLASRAGTYRVCWRALEGRVPRNEDFTLEVWVLRGAEPAREALLGVNAWMPDHGHGMLRSPRPVARGDGSFLVEGMLLHMRGHWQLFFEVLEGALSETAEHALDL